MAGKKRRVTPRKVGVSRSGAAGSRFDASAESDAFEPKERDLARAARKGQSGKKGRPLPSRKVAVKGLEEERKVRAKRTMRRRKSVSS